MNRILQGEEEGMEDKSVATDPDQSCKSCLKTKGAVKT
jgi:hypothetical protein